MEQLPEIWVVGGSGCGKSSLISSISSRPINTDSNTSLWKISNKYYTADVLFSEKLVEQFHPNLSDVTCEALVLVFNARSESSFKSVSDWIQSRDSEDIQIRLLVATHVDETSALPSPSGATYPNSDNTQTREPWIEDAISWSCENGFEYIETAPAVPAVDRSLVLDGDAQGVKRVSMALQSHSWPNCTLVSHHARSKKHQQPTAGASLLKPADASEDSSFPSSSAILSVPESRQGLESSRQQQTTDTEPSFPPPTSSSPSFSFPSSSSPSAPASSPLPSSSLPTPSPLPAPSYAEGKTPGPADVGADGVASSSSCASGFPADVLFSRDSGDCSASESVAGACTAVSVRGTAASAVGANVCPVGARRLGEDGPSEEQGKAKQGMVGESEPSRKADERSKEGGDGKKDAGEGVVKGERERRKESEAAPAGKTKAPAKKKGEEDSDLIDEDFETFEKLIGRATQTRGELSSLSDEARRQQAADFALNFARMLGMVDGDDGSEDEGSESESD